MLSAVKLCKVLGGRKVLDDVSFDVSLGQTVALFGENGAGKSTLLRILAGVMDADAGRVLLFEKNLLGPRAAARTRIGYVPEAADAPPHLTPRELVGLVASLKRSALPEASLFARLGIESYLDQQLGSLSLGQRRRSCLAVALVGDVRLLLLDEPTNGLDASGVAMLVDVLAEHARAGGMSVVATHDEAFAGMTNACRLRMEAGRASS